MPVFTATQVCPKRGVKRSVVVIADDQVGARKAIESGAGDVVAEVPATQQEIEDANAVLQLRDRYLMAQTGDVRMEYVGPNQRVHGYAGNGGPDFGSWFEQVAVKGRAQVGVRLLTAEQQAQAKAKAEEEAKRVKRERALAQGGHFVKRLKTLCLEYGVDLHGNDGQYVRNFTASIEGVPLERLYVSGPNGAGSFSLKA